VTPRMATVANLLPATAPATLSTASTPAPATVPCVSCGTSLDAGGRFCASCGTAQFAPCKYCTKENHKKAVACEHCHCVFFEDDDEDEDADVPLLNTKCPGCGAINPTMPTCSVCKWAFSLDGIEDSDDDS
jgi:hypothetical protein